MRKALFPALLAALLLLSSCGGTGAAAAKPYRITDPQTLLDAGAFSGEMEEVDTDVATALYGIDGAAVQACACLMAADTSVSADEAAVFVLTTRDEAAKAAEACHRRAEKLIEQCRDYCPDQVPKLENATVIQRGLTVLYAVGDAATLGPALEELGLN